MMELKTFNKYLKTTTLKQKAMTKSEIFKAAHKLTKETIKKGFSYSATFGLCLSFVYSNKSQDNFEVYTNGGAN